MPMRQCPARILHSTATGVQDQGIKIAASVALAETSARARGSYPLQWMS